MKIKLKVIDSKKTLTINEAEKNNLVDQHLIHFNGIDWVCFDDSVEAIESILNEGKTKVAKLVTVTLITRVVVDKNASESEILAKAQGAYHEKVDYELSENLDSIKDDTECPYNESED